MLPCLQPATSSCLLPHQPHSLLCPGTGTPRGCQPCLGDSNTAEESSCKGPVRLHPNQRSPLFPAPHQEPLPELEVPGPRSDPQTCLHVEALTRAVFSWHSICMAGLAGSVCQLVPWHTSSCDPCIPQSPLQLSHLDLPQVPAVVLSSCTGRAEE